MGSTKEGATYLHVGDRITLLDDSWGYVGANGFANVQVGTSVLDATSAVLSYLTSRDSVFLIRPQHDYSVVKKLRQEAEKMGLTMNEVKNDPRFRRRMEQRAREVAMNKQAFQQSTGREVRYGMVVQLQHDTSQKYLRVAKQASEVNKEGRRVVLDRDAGEEAWFRIMPRLRVHSEGERVHVGDPILLEHVNTALGVRVEGDKNSLPLSDGRREVLATPTGTPLKVEQYRSFSDAGRAFHTLLSGQPVRLVHKEADGTLGSHSHSTAEKKVYVNTNKQAADLSSNTVWAIEHTTPLDGAICDWR